MSRHLLADCIRIEMPILYVLLLTSGFHPQIILPISFSATNLYLWDSTGTGV